MTALSHMSPFEKIVTYTIDEATRRERERIVAIIRDNVSAMPGGPEAADRLIREIQRGMGE